MRVYWGVLLAVAMSSAATADTVYHWEGTCTLGCTGTASADLTLAAGSPFNFNANYFPTHDVSDFISFQYTSSSGTFFLDNTSPYLYAQGGAPFVTNGILLEENGQGPNTLPLWQFGDNLSVQSPGTWQFLYGSYFWTCLDAQCTTWTDDIIRNVGVDGVFALVQTPAVPEPSTWAMLLIGFAGIGWLAHRQHRKLARLI